MKGTKFLNLRDAGDPVECASAYDQQGADELVFLDITASSDNRAAMVDVVERTADCCFMPLTVGGGIRSVEDVRMMLRAGADKISLNTAAVARPELIREASKKFGSQCIVVAIDAKTVLSSKFKVQSSKLSAETSTPRSAFRVPRSELSTESSVPHSALRTPYSWEVYTHGGRKTTGLDVVEWAKKVESLGAGEILLTSMDRDGTKKGYDIDLLRLFSKTVPG